MVANGILRLSNKCQQMYMLIDNEQKKKDGKATFEERKYNLYNNFDVFLCCTVLEILYNLVKVKA
ncbi:hypothetical protein T4D_12887 [Trichinella pseudospiralis]|uniref:Uncharacterized protein n=1 Tax=Trichinella pseudospiralis TaxID=6337 RepID=A0A0V1FCY4_TRIPS|nr:hypothetical protein T4D_12887 [Trichinella pseudospiralis]